MRRVLWLLLLCMGCGRVSVDQEYALLRQESCRRTGYPVVWQTKCETSSTLPTTRDEAVRLALAYHPKLQAMLEDLGMSKADLVQAGLLTNPFFVLDQRNPPPGASNEASLLFWFHDLWQLPFRRARAQRQTEATRWDLIVAILDTVRETKQMYDEVLLHQAMLATEKKILEATNQLCEQIEYREHFGYSTTLDISLAKKMVADVRIKIVDLERLLSMSVLNLCERFGLEGCQLELTESPSRPDFVLPPAEDLIARAKTYNPDLGRLRVQIAEAEANLRLQKVRFIRELGLGVAYEKSPGTRAGYGPSLALQLPLFDQNRAQIAKARFRLRQLKKELLAKQLAVTTQLRQAMQRYQSAQAQLSIYIEEVVPALDQAVTYTNRYSKTMQLNVLHLIEAYRSHAEATQTYWQLVNAANDAIVDIERLIGCVFKMN